MEYNRFGTHFNVVFFFLDIAMDRFGQKEYTADVFEDAAGGAFVAQIEARSVSSLLYDIVDGDADGAFLVNPSTGAVLLAPRSTLDYETRRHYNLTIHAMNMVPISIYIYIFIYIYIHFYIYI